MEKKFVINVVKQNHTKNLYFTFIKTGNLKRTIQCSSEALDGKQMLGIFINNFYIVGYLSKVDLSY